MARRSVQYGVVNASDADVGVGAPGFRTTWQSKDDLRQQVMKISDVPNSGKLYFWDGQLWLRWDDPDDLPGPEGDPLRIKIVCPQNAGPQKLPVPNYYTLNVPAPSSLSASAIRKLQALGNSNNQLANHQPLLLNLRPSFAAPAPLQLAHPSFGVFLDVFYAKTTLPSRRDFSFLSELALKGSNIFESEKERQDLTIRMLGDYLRLPITPWPELFPDCGRQRPDAADVDKEKGATLMSFLVEVKNEAKSTPINPYMQGNLYYYQFWRHEPRCYSNLHQFSCCPALLLELVGPSLRVSGLAFADQVMCQPLMPAISLLTMAALDREQMAAAAQALVALRCTVHAIRQSYNVLQQNFPLLQQPEALQHHYAARAQQLLLGQQMHEGLVPRDLLLQRLPYRLQMPCVNVQRLMPTKELYVMAFDNHQPRLVKYTQSYGMNVHKVWAAAIPAMAPTLFSCLRLPGGWWEVQMELLTSQDGWVRLDEAPQHRPAAVHALRAAHGLVVDQNRHGVHGDARDVNVFVRVVHGGNVDVRFVDFDWAGLSGVVRYPPFMNHAGVNWPAGALDGQPILPQHDVELLSNTMQQRLLPYAWQHDV